MTPTQNDESLVADVSTPARKEATGRPWSVGNDGRLIICLVPDIADGYDHFTIAVLTAHSLVSVSEAKANAALIVEAVNALEPNERRIAELEAENVRLRGVVQFVEAWVHNPVGAYSVHALDGLFATTRDKIARAALEGTKA